MPAESEAGAWNMAGAGSRDRVRKTERVRDEAFTRAEDISIAFRNAYQSRKTLRYVSNFEMAQAAY